MSELSELLAGIDGIKLRQSRAIARIVDRQRAAPAFAGAGSEAGPFEKTSGAEAEDTGYDFAVAIVAAATDRSPAEIEELGGSILELGPAVARIMSLAGFSSAGEGGPAAIPGSSPGMGGGPRTGSGGSMPPSPPATDTPLN
jgi:hypothetical protein